MSDSLALAEHIITGARGGQHVSINAAKVITARRDPQLAAIVADAALATADGQSIVLAGRLLGTPMPERVTGIDFMTALLTLAGRRGYTVYLYGAKPSTVTSVNALITGRGINVVGYDSGFEPEPATVAARIAALAPDLLFVALPTPAKELFIGRPSRPSASVSPSESAARSTSSPARCRAHRCGCNGWAWNGHTGSRSNRSG